MLAQGQSSSAKRGGLAADISSGLIFLKKKKKEKKKIPFTIAPPKLHKYKSNKLCIRPICGKLQSSDKNIKDNLNKRRDIPCSQIERLSIVKMSVPPNLIYLIVLSSGSWLLETHWTAEQTPAPSFYAILLPSGAISDNAALLFVGLSWPVFLEVGGQVLLPSLSSSRSSAETCPPCVPAGIRNPGGRAFSFTATGSRHSATTNRWVLWFPDQEMNPGCCGEGTESSPLAHQGWLFEI